MRPDYISGGSFGGVNCQVHALAPGVLEPGIHYWVDADPRWLGVYYAPDFLFLK